MAKNGNSDRISLLREILMILFYMEYNKFPYILSFDHFSNTAKTLYEWWRVENNNCVTHYEIEDCNPFNGTFDGEFTGMLIKEPIERDCRDCDSGEVNKPEDFKSPHKTQIVFDIPPQLMAAIFGGNVSQYYVIECTVEVTTEFYFDDTFHSSEEEKILFEKNIK